MEHLPLMFFFATGWAITGNHLSWNPFLESLTRGKAGKAKVQPKGSSLSMAVLFIGHYFGYYNMGPWVCLKTGHPKTHWWQFSYHFPLEIVFAGRRSPIFHKMPHSRHETCDCQTFWDHDAGRKSTPLEAVGQSEANIS